MSVLHGNLVSGGGIHDVLTFSLTGPCIWLYATLCRVKVDIVLPSQIHDANSSAMRVCAWGLGKILVICRAR